MPWGALLPIAGLALSAAGTGLGVEGSVASNRAANNAAENELNIQKMFAKQGQPILQQSIAASSPKSVQEQMQQGEQTALKNYASLNQPEPNAGIPPGVGQSGKVENSQVGGKIAQQQGAAANLEGYGASDIAQMIKDLQAKVQLGQIGTFAQESENTLPLQLQQAGQKGATLSGIGSLLNSVGGLAALYGATKTPSYGGTIGVGTPSGIADWNLGYQNIG